MIPRYPNGFLRAVALRLNKAAERLGVDEATVIEWADSGYLDMTGYFADYFVTDDSVEKFAKAIDRYNSKKRERTRRKDRDKVLPDYLIRLDRVSALMGLPIHQARILASKHAFGARKVSGWWMMDGGLISLFMADHEDAKLNTAAKIVAQLKEDENV